jgi:mRNA interferase MazF
MASFSRTDVILVRYPFSDLSASKVRPAVIVGAPHPSMDVIVVPLTSRTSDLFPGEFSLGDWRGAGLNVPSAVKRGFYAAERTLIIRHVGTLAPADAERLDQSLRSWLGL